MIGSHIQSPLTAPNFGTAAEPSVKNGVIRSDDHDRKSAPPPPASWSANGPDPWSSWMNGASCARGACAGGAGGAGSGGAGGAAGGSGPPHGGHPGLSQAHPAPNPWASYSDTTPWNPNDWKIDRKCSKELSDLLYDWPKDRYSGWHTLMRNHILSCNHG